LLLSWLAGSVPRRHVPDHPDIVGYAIILGYFGAAMVAGVRGALTKGLSALWHRYSEEQA
jgi:hypothetical protein